MSKRNDSGITKSRSGHYTVWCSRADVPGGRKLELHEAQNLLARVQIAVGIIMFFRGIRQMGAE